MKGNNLKYFMLGAAIVATGLWASAVTIPNNFAAGDALSASKLNANFAAVKTAVDALEAPNSVTTAKIADSAVTTAKVADGAINAAKISDEPGGGQGFFQLEIPQSTPDFQVVDYGNVTIQAPGPGTILAIASGSVETTHTNGTKSAYIFGVKSGNKSRNQQVGLPATANTGTYQFSVSVQYMIPVAAAGPVSVTLFGDKVGPGVSGGAYLSLVYLPTNYGTIQ